MIASHMTVAVCKICELHAIKRDCFFLEAIQVQFEPAPKNALRKFKVLFVSNLFH